MKEEHYERARNAAMKRGMAVKIEQALSIGEALILADLEEIKLQNGQIIDLLHSIQISGEQYMAGTATTLAQLDAAIAAQTSAFQTLSAATAKLDTDVTGLIARVTSGEVSTPQDFTSELQAIQANTTALNTAVSSLTAEDTSAEAATAPPATTSSASGVSSASGAAAATTEASS